MLAILLLVAGGFALRLAYLATPSLDSDQAPDGSYVLEVGVWNPETREHLRLGWRGREKQRLLRLAASATEARVETE